MKVGFVKTIAALLVGSGLTLAQSPPSTSGKMSPRGTVLPAALADASYPAAAGQQSYSDPASSDAPVNFGGVNWRESAVNSNRVYTSAEYLMWNIHNTFLPTLATSVPVGLVQATQNDLFVGPGSTTTTPNPVVTTFSIPVAVSNNPTVANSNSIDMGEHNGGRVTLGIWCDDDHDLGFEVSSFWLEKLSEQFRNTTANSLNQFNLQTGLADRTFFVPLLGSPQLLSSGLTVFPAQSTSEVFGTLSTEMWGGEANVRTSGYRIGMATFGALAGVRYIHFQDNLALATSVNVIDAPQFMSHASFLPIQFSTFDRIKTNNEIFAPQIGAEAEVRCCGFFANVRGKFAIGPNFEQVNVNGRTTIVNSTNPVTNSPGGLLSGPSNLGEHNRTRVTVLPELNLKLGYEFGSCLRVHVGYDAMYLDHIARPGDQVSFNNLATTVTVAGTTNTTNITTPTIVQKDSNVWLEGLNFGVEFRF